MKRALVVIGVVLFLGGLVALFLGLVSLDATPCFIGGDCSPDAGSNGFLFPIGLASVIIGSCAWTAGAGTLFGSGKSGGASSIVGFFGIFGLTFFCVGAVMFIVDQQPTTDHTTNVLTVIGVVFTIVGLLAMAAEVAAHFSTARDARILASGVRGRATVTRVHDTNVTVNMNPMISLDLRVELPGQPVFTTTVRQVISRLEVGSYRPGLVLAVAGDPAKPRTIVVDWANSPITQKGSDTDPITGRPLEVDESGYLVAPPPGAAGAAVAGSGSVGSGTMSGADIASILRAAADQIASGGLVSHPVVASAVADSHTWTGGGQLTSDQIAAILRTAATNASGGRGASGSTGVPSNDLSTLLRTASAAASRAADSAEGASPPGASSTATPG